MCLISAGDGFASVLNWLRPLFEAAEASSFVWVVGIRMALILPLIGWLYLLRDRQSSWLRLAPLIALGAFSLLSVTFTSGADTDEVEHLHVSWLTHKGVLPYRDFHQNHAPLLWILSAPLFYLLPESAHVLYAFRALTLLSFALSCGLTGMLARRLSLTPSGGVIAACVFLCLSQAVDAQVYRFRPDTIMVTCALGSLCLLLRESSGRWLNFVIAGLLIGLAISLSPKAGLQLGVGALAMMVLWIQQRRWESLRLGVMYGAGLLLGLAPVIAWLAVNGLLQDTWQSIFPDNVQMLSGRRSAESLLATGRLVPRALNLVPFGVVMLVGTAVAASKALGRSQANRLQGLPPTLVAGSTFLFFAFALVAPNYLTYHVAGGLMAGAALGAVFIHQILLTGRRPARLLWVAIALVLCVNDSWFRSGLGGRVDGTTASTSDLQELLEVTRSRGNTCVCLAPMHPIFAYDAGGIYTGFDRYSQQWSHTVETILLEPPGVILDFSWRGLIQRGRLKPAQVIRLEDLLFDAYELREIGPERFWLLLPPPLP